MNSETYLPKKHVDTLLNELSYISALFKAGKIEHLPDWAEFEISQALKGIRNVYKHTQDMTLTTEKILTLNEFNQDFLDFNEFGPDDGSNNPQNSEMTLTDFISLPHFENTENIDKAIQALTVNEILEISMLNNADIVLKPDNEKVTVVVDKLEIDFVKEDLLNALTKKLAEMEEIVEHHLSILKFKQYININKL
jgi:hypothetical protein